MSFKQAITTLQRLCQLLFSLFLLSVLGCSTSVNLNVSRKFQAAEQMFAQAKSPQDYLRVASLYQEILDSGFRSGVILFNQGNAFMKAGRRGRAIAAYRQAQRYRPRDPFLDANLRYALGTLPARRQSLLDHIFFWQDRVSYPEKFFLVTIAAAAAFVLGFGAHLASRQRLWSRLSWCAAGLTLVVALSAGNDWYNIEQVEHGVVITEKTIARKGDSVNYEPAFTQPLPEGTEFTVLERRSNWLYVRVDQVGTGWIEEQNAVTY